MEILINQDIRKFKTKDIGAFSFKEVGWIGLACACGYAAYFIQKKYTGEVTLESCIPWMIPALVFGFLKPFGLTFFQFLKTVIVEKMLTPKCYYWESDFTYDMDEFGETYGEEYSISEERLTAMSHSTEQEKKKLTKQEEKAIKAANSMKIL